MKHFLLLSFLILAFTSCKRSASAENQSNTPLPTAAPNPIVQSNAATSADTTAHSKEDPLPETKTLVPAKPKICDPNFTKLKSPKQHHSIVYVTNFNPEEFKCWVLLEEYGTELTGGNPGVVYFVDKANIKATTTPPHFLDDNTLKTAGIGRYEHNGKYWELIGSSRWKRTDKGYGYYNTDNQAGG